MDRTKQVFSIKNLLLMFLTGILILAVTFGSKQYENWVGSNTRAEVAENLEIYADSVHSILARRVGLINGLDRFVSQRDHQSIEKEFSIFASGLHNDFEGVRNVAIAPNGIYSFVYPVTGNEEVINYNLLKDNTPRVKADIARTMHSRDVVITDPFQLQIGGLGMVARKAVYKNDKFWGFISVVVDVPTVIEYGGLVRGVMRYNMALRDKKGNIFWGDPQIFENNPVIQKVDTLDGYWELGGIPVGGWAGAIDRNVLIFKLLILLIGILVILLINLSLKHRISLELVEEKVMERTKSLRIVLIYAVISAAWIFLTDKGLVAVFGDPEIVNELQTAKGWLFVAVTSLLLYWLIEINFGRYLITNKALRSILAGNKLLVSANSETDLIQGICDEIVDKGGYVMAWVGMAMNDEEKSVKPVARAGKGKDFLDDIKITWGESDLGENPCGMTIRTGKAIIVNDTREVIFGGLWHLEIMKRNIGSMVSIPLTEDGRTFGVLTIYSSLVNAFSAGDVEILSGFSNDLVVGRKSIRLRKENEKNLELMKQVLRCMGDGVVVTDAKGKISLVNREVERLAETREKALLKKRFDEKILLKYEKNDSLVKNLIDKVIRKGVEVKSKEPLYLDKKGRKLPVDLLATPIRDVGDEVVGSVVIMRDVTKNRQLEKIRTDFVSLASHQLRSPLTGIKWFVELLLENVSNMSTEKVKDYIGKIGESNERLIDLVNDLLQTSRIEGGKYEEKKLENISVKELAQESVAIQEELIEKKNIKILGLEDIPGELLVEIDKVQMTQALSNLVNNAAIYSQRGSKVTYGAEQKGRDIIISVQDEGVGIPKDQHNKLFLKFFRADNVANKIAGSGLGLYVTKSIVEGHGGKIWFDSKEGKGTTFFVKLPIKQKNNG